MLSLTKMFRLKNKNRGLFARAEEYGGKFVRPFSQALDSNDVKMLFREKGCYVEELGGICSSTSFDFIYHNVMFCGKKNYSNNEIYRNVRDILAVQKYVRRNDIGLASFLTKLGFTKITKKLHLTSKGIHIISMQGFPGGNHVVVAITRETTLKLFDALKGEIEFNNFKNSKCSTWLKEYLESYKNSGAKKIQINSFSLEVNLSKITNSYVNLLLRHFSDIAIFYNLTKTSGNISIEDHDELLFKNPQKKGKMNQDFNIFKQPKSCINNNSNAPNDRLENERQLKLQIT